MKGFYFAKFFSADYWMKLFKSPLAIGSAFHKIFRIGTASYKGFIDDECSDKSSALTFYTLLSIIPVLAVAFGIAKGFGFEQHLENQILERFSDQPEVATKLIEFSQSMLQNTQSGLIAGVGLAVLFWSVLKLMSNIESSFNAIWKVKKPRSWPRRLSDYLAMMLFAPIFFAVSSSITVYITTKFMHITETSHMLKAVSPVVYLIFHLFPLVLSWLLFTALYFIMPNTKVPFKYALVAGIVAGTAYQIVQWLYIQFQIGLASYGAIYGSFAALPLFLLWLNTSWLIALAGAEIAYHAENDLMLTGDSFRQQGYADARVLGLLTMEQCIQTFQTGKRPPNIYDIAKQTGIGVMSAKQLVQKLVEHGLLVEITWRDGTGGYYQPARDVKSMRVKDVCDALDSARHERYAIIYSPLAEIYEKSLAAFDTLLKDSQINYPLDKLPHLTSQTAENKRIA